jgi:hypothetical protein
VNKCRLECHCSISSEHADNLYPRALKHICWATLNSTPYPRGAYLYYGIIIIITVPYYYYY